MIRERILELASKELMLEDFDLDADFVNKYDLDSIALLDFIMTLEEEFDIEISEKELNDVKSVNDIIAVIEKKADK